MEITPRQKLTIEHLKTIGIKTEEDIIKFCEKKLLLPQNRNHRHTPQKRIPGRKHSKKYYQGIIDFIKHE